MRKRFLKVALVLFTATLIPLLFSCEPEPEIEDDRVTLTAEEMELYNLLMTYRAELGLAEIPLSASLTIVAQTHVEDLQENNLIVGDCNAHSWSEFGDWAPCCYTADHAQAACMWDKPRELTVYPGNGFEIAAHSGGAISPLIALNSWKNSPGHDAVIKNEVPWKKEWKAIGIGLKGKYAAVWFGNEVDPAGPPR